MDIEQQQPTNRVLVRSFNEIQVQPTAINHMFYCQQDDNLYVSRDKSTEVYHVVNNVEGIQFQHIARLPWSKYALKVNGIIFLFCPFQLRTYTNGSWQTHPFTTELLSISIKTRSPTLTVIYSFHQQQVIEYKLSTNEDDEQLTMNFVPRAKVPFHVTKENIVEGYGKKVAASGKAGFTVADYKADDYLVVGDTEGAVHVYDYRTLGHLKTFKRHLGPILAIKIDQTTNTVFFTGSDSKVVSIKKINDQWILCGQVRGQSHDIFTLQLINKTLISGGLTTDICCYPLSSSSQLLQTYQNKISFCSQQLVHSMKNYLLVNKLTSFELWKVRESQQDLQFLVRYQMPPQKFIQDIKLSKRLNDKTHLIIVSTQIDTVGWKFDEENGLMKLFTIKNSYDFIEFIPGKNVFVGVRDTGDIEKVHCQSGKIDEVINIEMGLPTDVRLLSEEKLIVASNLTNQVRVFDLKKKILLAKLSLNKIYQVITQKSDTQFLIKYVSDRNLYSCNFSKKLIQQQPILQLPQTADNVRYGGVIIHQSQVTKNSKKYWYFATQTKLYLVNNLNSTKKKQIRSIYTRQIGTVVKPKVNKAFELGLVHLNFKRMVNNMQVKPLIAKKIV